jgi:hypothetical protein
VDFTFGRSNLYVSSKVTRILQLISVKCLVNKVMASRTLSEKESSIRHY